MAGKIKRLSRSDGVTVDSPTTIGFDGTLTAATVGGDDNDGTDGYLLLKDQSADPSATTGDDIKIFAKDKGLYKVDSTGVASEVGSGTGSGELNYITNPSGAVDTTGWIESTDGEVDISRTTTAGELPRENLVGTGLKIVGTGTTAEEYVAFDFNLDDSDLNKVLKIEWDQKPLGTYADGELDVVIYDLDNTAEIIPAVTEIPAMIGKFQTTWVTDSTSTNYELRIKNPNASATDGIVISNVIAGPGSRVQMPDPRWPSYDETEVTIETDLASETVNYARISLEQDTDDNWYMNFTVDLTHTATTSAFNITFADTTFAGASTSDLFPVAWSSGSGTVSGVAEAVGTTNYVRSRGDGTSISGTSITGSKIPLDSKPDWATKPAPDLYLSGAVNVDQVLVRGAMSSSVTYNTHDVIVFNSIETDTHSAYSSGVFTVPSDGVYTSNISLYDQAVTSDKYIGVEFFLDAVPKSAKATWNESTSSQPLYVEHGATFYALKGQEIRIKAAISDTNMTISGNATLKDSTFSIAKLPSPQDVANMIVGFNLAAENREGIVKKGIAVSDAAGATPTKAEFDALLESLRDAGVISE